MIRICVVGLGKMGLSHLSIIRMHPAAQLVGVCDLSKYFLDVLKKASGVAIFSDYEKMFAETKPDAVIVAVPTRFHAGVVKAALKHRVHVFCEKPFCLDLNESNRLAFEADEMGVVNQIGYHYRFVAAFQEMKRLIDLGAIGKISHVLAEAYGPVVVHSKGSTWRTQKEEGGGASTTTPRTRSTCSTGFSGSPTESAQPSSARSSQIRPMTRSTAPSAIAMD